MCPSHYLCRMEKNVYAGTVYILLMEEKWLGEGGYKWSYKNLSVFTFTEVIAVVNKFIDA